VPPGVLIPHPCASITLTLGKPDIMYFRDITIGQFNVVADVVDFGIGDGGDDEARGGLHG
jgi:hypothetical protein